MLLGRGRVPVDPAEQDLSGQRPDGRRVLSHDRHRRLQEISEREIIETDQRGAVLQGRVAKRTDRADGDQVLLAEQRRRRVGPGKQLARRGLGSTDRVQVLPHQMVVGGETRLAQRVLESGEALLGGRDRGEITQVGDPAVAVRYQVPDTVGRPGAGRSGG